jgi:CRP/FNR family transcriptional regulator, dissimilatory nitrate respiration regulator
MIAIMSLELLDVLEREAARVLILAEGEVLFRRNDRVVSMYLLIDGGIDLIRYQRDGKEVVLNRARTRTPLAEASLYSVGYHCDAVCIAPATVAAIARKRLLKLLDENRDLARQWSAYLAGALQDARYRSELLTRKTVEDRLAGWLEWNGGALPPKGRWRSLASEIGVTPEALYRQLAKRR